MGTTISIIILVLYIYTAKKCNSYFKKNILETSKRIVLWSNILFVRQISHFLLAKNLPKHIFAWNKKSFSWNNHKKNFLMLSNNLLDLGKFFLPLR